MRQEPINPADFAYYGEKVDTDLVGNQNGIVDEPPNSYKVEEDIDMEEPATLTAIDKERISKEGAPVDKQTKKNETPKGAAEATAGVAAPGVTVPKGASLAVVADDELKGGAPSVASTEPPTPALGTPAADKVPDDISSFLAYHEKGSDGNKPDAPVARKRPPGIGADVVLEDVEMEKTKKEKSRVKFRKEVEGSKKVEPFQVPKTAAAGVALPRGKSVKPREPGAIPVPSPPKTVVAPIGDVPASLPPPKLDVVMSEAPAPPTESLTQAASKEAKKPRVISKQMLGKGEQVAPLVTTKKVRPTDAPPAIPKAAPPKEKTIAERRKDLEKEGASVIAKAHATLPLQSAQEIEDSYVASHWQLGKIERMKPEEQQRIKETHRDVEANAPGAPGRAEKVEEPKILTRKPLVDETGLSESDIKKGLHIKSFIEGDDKHEKTIEKNFAKIEKWWDDERKSRSMLRPMHNDNAGEFTVEDLALMKKHYIETIPTDEQLGIRPIQSQVIQDAINQYLDETKKVVEPLGRKPNPSNDPTGVKTTRWLENYENQVAPIRQRWNFPDVYAAILHKLGNISDVTDETREGLKKILAVYFNTEEERAREKEWRKKFSSAYGHV